MAETFSVVQFFDDDNKMYEFVRENVPIEEALTAFKHYTDNVAVKMGITKRVIILDGGDCVNVEWINGKGIVFPPPEALNTPNTQGD